jgi:tRNA threonylcarbamoyladenosine biosynthesis protein TsaB
VLTLAFDTSGFSGSVALVDGESVLDERDLVAERRSAQTLAPAIADLLAAQGLQPQQIRLVATTIGPGSFTGLRVGVTTAKAFAYAVGAEVIGISTLEAIACGVPCELWRDKSQPFVIDAVLDAQRGELFVARFRGDSGPGNSDGLPRLTRSSPDQIMAAEAWLAGLPAGTVVTGPGLKRVEARLPAGVAVVPADRREARASVVGRLAWRDYAAGRRDDLWKLAPVYLRPSYAEEKAGKKTP